MFKLEDFIASMPDQDDPNIQQKITAKREINEIIPNRIERIQPRGEYFTHQEVFYRIFKNYPRCLILDKAGVGKTCSVIHISEYLKNIFKYPKLVSDEFPHINKIYFFVKGPNLEEELVNQLFFKCTSEGTYDTENIVSAKNNKQKSNLITRKLEQEGYIIKKFRSLANELYKKSDAQIIQEYSGSMIFIDEAQYLKTESDDFTDEFDFDESEETEIKESLDPQKSEKELKNNQNVIETAETRSTNKHKDANIYKQMHRLTHLVKRSQIYIATATPMINSPAEMASIMNLILPLDKQMSHKDINWYTAGLDVFEKYFRGYISFVRELDTGIYQKQIGRTSNFHFETLTTKNELKNIKSQIVLHSTIMDQFQTDAYERSKNIEKFNKQNKKIKNSFYLEELSASNFIFPDGSWGGDFAEKKKENVQRRGIAKYVNLIKNDEFEPTPEFEKYLSDINNIRKSSSKYYDIVKRYTPDKKINPNPNKGSVFIYGDSKSGSGLYVLSLCLRAHGFSQFLDNFSSFEYNEASGNVILKLEKKPRYAIITGDTPKLRRKIIYELFRSYENRYGEYIKIILGSEVTQAGINFSNVLNFELITAGWHMSGIYQALSRIIRATSHEFLLQELRRTDPTGVLDISIYRHCAHTKEQYVNFLDKTYEFNDSLKPGEISTDLYLYMVSEDKDIRIKRIEHFAVLCSLNYYITFYRNHRPTDVDYTSICFYDICDKLKDKEYLPLKPTDKWDDLRNPNVDFSTYDLYYVDEIINHITTIYRTIFTKIGSIDFYSLVSMKELQKFPPRYLIFTLNNVISKKIIFYNSLGLPGYLQMDNNHIYLNIEYSKELDHLYTYYSENVILNLNYNFNEYLQKTDTQKTIRISNVLEEKNISNIDSNLSKLSNLEKVHILEKSITDKINNVATESELIIYAKYAHIIFYFNLPIDALEKANNLYITFRNSGRKNIYPLFKKLINDIDFNKTNNNKVVLHTLYDINSDKTAYKTGTSIRKAIGKLKIYIDNRWRDVLDYEDLIYRYMINYTMNDTINKFEKLNLIYGIVQNDGFRIRNPEEKGKGKICTSYDKPDLIYILYKLGYELEKYTSELQNLTDQEINTYIQDLKKNKIPEKYYLDSDNIIYDRVVYFKNILDSKHKVIDLCDIIEEYLNSEEINRILDIDKIEYNNPIQIYPPSYSETSSEIATPFFEETEYEYLPPEQEF